MLIPVRCPACAAKINGEHARCLRCGTLLHQPYVAAEPPRSGRWFTVGASAAIVALTGVAFTMPGPTANTAVASNAVAAKAASATRDGRRTTTRPALDVETQTGSAAGFASREASAEAIAAYSHGDVAASVEQFTRAVDADPTSAVALNNLGQALVRAGRARAAIPYFDRAIALADGAWSYHFNRARAYAELQQWSPAIAGYRRAEALFPGDYVTQFNLARALQASGDLPAAIAGFERAIELAPGESDFHLSYGRALEAGGRPRDAAAAYKRFLDLEPSSPERDRVAARIAALDTPNAAGANPKVR